MQQPDEVFPPGFFERSDPSPDPTFYSWPRLVTHIDDGAIAAVGELYEELGIDGTVLDLMGSWVSHFRTTPAHLTVLGMNAEELAANPQAAATVLHDLNADPVLPFADETFDAAVCCVSVDYLPARWKCSPTSGACCARARRSCARSRIGASRPRRSGAGCTPTTSSTARSSRRTSRSQPALGPGWSRAVAQRRTPPGHRGDPLYAVWATREGLDERPPTMRPHGCTPGDPVDDGQRRAAVVAGDPAQPRPRAGRRVRPFTRQGRRRRRGPLRPRRAVGHHRHRTTPARCSRSHPDACSYNPMWPSVDELTRLLEAGVNVCSTSAFITGSGGPPRTSTACALRPSAATRRCSARASIPASRTSSGS